MRRLASHCYAVSRILAGRDRSPAVRHYYEDPDVSGGLVISVMFCYEKC